LESNPILENIHVELLTDKKNIINRYSAKKTCPKCCRDSLNVDEFLKQINTGNNKQQTGKWSIPFFCRKNPKHLLVNYRYPIFSIPENVLLGVVSCEISLKKLDSMLSNIKVGQEGYAFVIDKTGEIITHPNQDIIFRENFFNDSMRVFIENAEVVENQIKSGGRGAGYGISQYLNNQRAWFYFAPLGLTEWHIIIVVPEKELQKEINEVFQQIIIVSVIGLVILFLANFIIFRRVLNPLIRITHAIQRFSYIPGKTKKTKDEIKMLATSLEDWQSKYGLLIKEQLETKREKVKYEKDIESAREIQFNIIPSGKPEFIDYPQIDLFAVLKPAGLVGGDLYDYFFVDKNHLLLAIGDVSGKGIAASLFMAIASTLIKTHAKVLSAKEIVSLVNEELSQRNSNQYFVTLFIGILDVTTGMMEYCNAAHNFPYILHPDGSLKTLSDSHGLPLGIYKNKKYESNTVELKFGDMLLMYTDGVINSEDGSNAHYGVDRLEKNILNMNHLDSEEVANRLLKSVLIYESEEFQSDDVTLLILRFLNKEENQT